MFLANESIESNNLLYVPHPQSLKMLIWMFQL